MAVIKQFGYGIYRWEYSGLCLLVLLSLALHFVIIDNPAEMLFDEQHYVNDARTVIQGGESLRLEHPSLGKIFVVSGMRLFGDKPLGWRFFSVILGTIGIIFFYLICRRLGMSRRTAYIATFLLTLENMTFVQASVAMLDVFTLPFMFACIWLYLRGDYLTAGVIAGLCTQTKLNGIMIVLAIFLHWAIMRRDKPIFMGGAVLLVIASFVGTMPLFDYFVYHRLTNPIERINTMMSMSSSLTFVTAAHPCATRPWVWILRSDIIPFWYDPHYLDAISYSVLFLIIPAVGYMIFKGIRRDDAAVFGVLWFVAIYLVWIPLSLATDRVSFVYYFYPAVGAICIGLALGLSQLFDIWQARQTGKLRWAAISTATGYLVIHVIVFTMMSPLSWLTWSKVPFLSIHW